MLQAVVQEQTSPMATVNVAAHFKSEEKRHHELVTKREAQKNALQAELKSTKDTIQRLTQERKKKFDLMSQNQAEGIDTEKLASRIGVLDDQIAAETQKQLALQQDVDHPAKVGEKSFHREHLLARILAREANCMDAVAVAGLRECYSHLQVELVDTDKAGHPKKLRLHVGAHHHEVTIKNAESRYLARYLPDSLEWLPERSTSATPNGRGRSGFLAFFDKSSQSFILSQTVFEWEEVSKVVVSWGQRTARREDFSGLAVSLQAHVMELLARENGEIDLQKTYSDNDLVECLRSRVLEWTTSDPQFKPSEEHLVSTAIYARIKADWDALIACPWTGEVDGALALLKYHSENGERTRFWSGDFEGQYGFRLRTHDHSWIVGQVFIDKSGQAPSAASPMAIRSRGYSSEVVATLGRLYLTVDRLE